MVRDCTWNTKPILRLNDLDKGLPSTKTPPDTLLGGTLCARTFRRLVFPLPEGPIWTIESPTQQARQPTMYVHVYVNVGTMDKASTTPSRWYGNPVKSCPYMQYTVSIDTCSVQGVQSENGDEGECSLQMCDIECFDQSITHVT